MKSEVGKMEMKLPFREGSWGVAAPQSNPGQPLERPSECPVDYCEDCLVQCKESAQ